MLTYGGGESWNCGMFLSTGGVTGFMSIGVAGFSNGGEGIRSNTGGVAGFSMKGDIGCGDGGVGSLGNDWITGAVGIGIAVSSITAGVGGDGGGVGGGAGTAVDNTWGGCDGGTGDACRLKVLTSWTVNDLQEFVSFGYGWIRSLSISSTKK